MKVLTPLQEDFIKFFAGTSLKDSFFLTGGTALSAFYLQHRVSEDMDFFTEEEGQVPQVLPILQEIVSKLNAQLEIKRSFRSYLEVFLTQEKGIVVILPWIHRIGWKRKFLSRSMGYMWTMFWISHATNSPPSTIEATQRIS